MRTNRTPRGPYLARALTLAATIATLAVGSPANANDPGPQLPAPGIDLVGVMGELIVKDNAGTSNSTRKKDPQTLNLQAVAKHEAARRARKGAYALAHNGLVDASRSTFGFTAIAGQSSSLAPPNELTEGLDDYNISATFTPIRGTRYLLLEYSATDVTTGGEASPLKVELFPQQIVVAYTRDVKAERSTLYGGPIKGTEIKLYSMGVVNGQTPAYGFIYETTLFVPDDASDLPWYLDVPRVTVKYYRVHGTLESGTVIDQNFPWAD